MLQRTATHCNALQRTATHCNTLQYTAAHCNAQRRTATHCNALQHTVTHCNTLQHTATHCSSLSRPHHIHTFTILLDSPSPPRLYTSRIQRGVATSRLIHMCVIHVCGVTRPTYLHNFFSPETVQSYNGVCARTVMTHSCVCRRCVCHPCV